MDTTLQSETRSERGKNLARRLRRSGRLPGVVYGDPGGQSGPAQVLIKDYQLHPVTRELWHVDFLRVATDKVITVAVRVVLTGEAEGVKMQGGLIAFEQREFSIECLPTEIPEHVEVDVSSLKIGQGIRVQDLLEGVSWKPVTDPATLIVYVIAPKVEEEPEAEEEEVAAEAGTTPEGEDAEKSEKADDAGKSDN